MKLKLPANDDNIEKNEGTLDSVHRLFKHCSLCLERIPKIGEYPEVGGLRERDYQLAAQKRNEACRRFDYHCQTAKYFERESRLAEHFNSWSSRDINSDKYLDNKTKVENLGRRKSNLRKMLRDEDAIYRSEMNRAKYFHDKQHAEEESMEELKEKLETKRAERALYYPQNHRCYQSCNGVSGSVPSSCPRHYENERHIDACRNSQLSMEETNLRNYSSDCQSRRENPENRHHGEKRHIQGHTMYGTNLDSFGDNTFANKPTKTTGERRHYGVAVDSVDEGTNPHHGRGDSDNVSVATSGNYSSDEQERSLGYSGHAAISEKRHYYQQSSADSFRTLANTNMRAISAGKTMADIEIEVGAAEERKREEETEEEREDRQEEEEAEEEREREAEAEAEAEEQEEIRSDKNEGWDHSHRAADEPKATSPGSMGYDNRKNWSTDNINFSWKYDDAAKRAVCFRTHNQLITQIEDMENRELQACKKQNWSEALRLRDMRNRLELQREIEIFNHNDLNMNNAARRSEMMKIGERIKLMDKREAGGNQPLVYSEEARTLWEARVREDDRILSKVDRAQREILLKQLEEEWEAITLKEKEQVAESPVKHNKSHLQEELELTASAMEKLEASPRYHASNEDSKNSCTRNKDKGAMSFIFLG